MKKILVIAAAAAFAFCACEKDNTDKVQGSGNNGGADKVSGIVLNELSGADKFIELYNTTDKEISLEGVYLVKYDSSKDGGKSTTWTGKAGMKIAAKGFVVLESSDLADEAEGGVQHTSMRAQTTCSRVVSQARRTCSSSSTAQLTRSSASSREVTREQAGTRFQASTTTRSTLSHAYRTEQVSSYTLTLPRVLQTVQRLLTSSRLLKCNNCL